VTLVGTIAGEPPRYSLRVGGSAVALRIACDAATEPAGVVSVTGIGVAPAEVIVPCDGMRAAPTLARVMTPVTDRTAPPRARAKTALAHPSPREEPRMIAAALLALGAAVVGGCGAYVRRRALRDALILEGAADGPPGEESEIPRLTLVRLEREGS
jgi:hypothetical protein